MYSNRNGTVFKHQHNRSVDDVIVKKEDIVPNMKTKNKVYYESLLSKVSKKARMASNVHTKLQTVYMRDQNQLRTPMETMRNDSKSINDDLQLVSKNLK